MANNYQKAINESLKGIHEIRKEIQKIEYSLVKINTLKNELCNNKK